MTDKIKWRDAKKLRDKIAQIEAERDHYKTRAERAEEAGELLKVAATEIGKDPDCGFAQALNDAIGAWEATLAQIDAEPTEPRRIRCRKRRGCC